MFYNSVMLITTNSWPGEASVTESLFREYDKQSSSLSDLNNLWNCSSSFGAFNCPLSVLLG